MSIIENRLFSKDEVRADGVWKAGLCKRAYALGALHNDMGYIISVARIDSDRFKSKY
jgi:hypothetical protein